MYMDLLYMGIGIFLLIPVPLLLSKWNHIIENRVTEKKVIYFATLFSLFFFLEIYGNSELLTGFIIGNCMCYLLVFEGIYRLFHLEKDKNEGKGNNYFLSFSVIITLILSADYLFSKSGRNNQLNRMDGILLLFLFLLFLFSEFRKYSLQEFREMIFSIRDKGKKGLYYLILVMLLLVGSFFLINGSMGVSIEKRISFQLVGSFFLPWVAGFIPVYAGREQDIAGEMVRTATFDMVLFFLLFFGLGAVISPVSTGYDTIYDFIFFSVISVALVWKNHVKNNIAGSLMLTMYIAFLIIHLL